MRYNKTILILYGKPIEVFTDLKKFCNIKGVNYNTYKQKKFPITYNGMSLVKEKKEDSLEFVRICGELIEIQ